MERIRSRVALALGGAVRVPGGGLIALAAVGLLAAVGCTGTRARFREVLPHGWVPSEPATQLVCAFHPQVQHLPDPSRDGVMGAGLAGQMYLIAAGGSFTEVNGDLYVMADDVTQRPPGHPPAVPEIWHFDSATLRKLRTQDERFGECYALFLPYPSNWKDVTHIRISTQYKPKGDPTKEPTLPGPPQTVVLDFTPVGEQSRVRVDRNETRVTAPVEMKAIPNVTRDIARGGFGAPLTGPQPNTGTVNAGITPPTNPVVPTGGLVPGPMPPAGVNPFAAPPTGAAPPAPNTPQLPPPMTFTPDRPQTTVRGPNGETLNVTAMALPPGQTVPSGWAKQPDGSIQPPPVSAPGQPQQPLQQTWPAQAGYTATAPAGYQPASAKFVPASERHGQQQPRTQQVTYNPPQLQPPASLPPLPATALTPARTALPPVGYVPGGVPALPTAPSGVSGPVMPVNLPPQPGAALAPPNFDPNLPVGGWAIQPPPPPGGIPGHPTVTPPVPGGFDPPNVTQTIKRY